MRTPKLLHFAASLALTALFLWTRPCIASASLAGRYVGTMHYSSHELIQTVKLDLVEVKDEATLTTYLGILTLHFGGFASTEYVTYRFPEIVWDKEQHQLAFMPGEQDFYVNVNSYDAERGSLELSIEATSFQGASGTLKMVKNGSIRDE